MRETGPLADCSERKRVGGKYTMLEEFRLEVRDALVTGSGRRLGGVDRAENGCGARGSISTAPTRIDCGATAYLAGAVEPDGF